MSDLDPRKQTLLRAVILEYVQGAEPVGSELLAQKYELGVKSATIRNELAELAELGYLEQPHTSAGRIPSDRGYRYYVDRLIVREEPEEATRAQVESVGVEGEALQRVLQDTAVLLSRLTQHMTIAATLRDASLTVRHAVLSAMGPHQALLVLILANAHMENRMLECPAGLTLDDVGRINRAIEDQVVGKTLRSLSKARPSLTTDNPATAQLLGTIWHTIRTLARELTRGKLITEGEEFLFAKPEYQKDLSALTALIEQLQGSDLLYEAVSQGDQPEVVIIGKENRSETLHRLSVVRGTFYVGDAEAGFVAVVGPTRMLYDRSIPLVNYTARALSQSLTKFNS